MELSPEQKSENFQKAVQRAMRHLHVLRTDRNIPWPKDPLKRFDFANYVESKYANPA